MDIWKNSISREHIEEIANSREKQRIRTMDYFSDAWNLVQQDLGSQILYSFITFLVIQTFSFLGNPLYAGWYITAYVKRKNEAISFNTFFKCFDHYGSLLLFYVLTFLVLFFPMMAAIIPGALFIDMMPSEDAGIIIFMIYMILVMLFFFILYMMFLFAPLLIVFSNLDAWSAMKYSFKVVKNNFGGFMGFIAMTIIMGILGIMTCGLLFLVILPVMQVATYYAYEDIFKPEMADDMDDVIRHLV